jgi:hypothetical protein
MLDPISYRRPERPAKHPADELADLRFVRFRLQRREKRLREILGQPGQSQVGARYEAVTEERIFRRTGERVQCVRLFRLPGTPPGRA